MRAHGFSRALGVFAVVGLTAVLITGCGSSTNQAAQVPTVTALTRAAYVSAAAQGYKVAFALQETIANQGEITATGNGTFSPSAHAGQLTMQMHVPTAAKLGDLQFQLVLTHSTMYMKMPAVLASKLPGGKPWFSIDLAQLGKAAGIPGYGSLMSGTSSINDPGQYLDYLRATAPGTVHNLGSATVNGVATTHYRADVTLSKLAAAVPAAQRPAMQKLVAAMSARTKIGQMPIDAWIDSSHLIRRIGLHFTEAVSTGQSVTVNMTENFLAYGPQPAPQTPPASETTNLGKLIGG